MHATQMAVCEAVDAPAQGCVIILEGDLARTEMSRVLSIECERGTYSGSMTWVHDSGALPSSVALRCRVPTPWSLDCRSVLLLVARVVPGVGSHGAASCDDASSLEFDA